MYRELADNTPGVYFCGRLANYKYFNMDQVVAQALHLYRNIAEEEAAEAILQPKRPASAVPATVHPHAATEAIPVSTESLAS